MGTHLRALSDSYLMNTNMTAFRWFSKTVASFAFDDISFSIGRVLTFTFITVLWCFSVRSQKPRTADVIHLLHPQRFINIFGICI